VAEELSVTLSTVRIHLQRGFEKTQTHRQAELVRLLLDIQADG
jgi:DNA-binding CsgD family transcriptional regulator